jgi:head-tail adaptor
MTPAGEFNQTLVFQRNIAGRSALGGKAAANWESIGSRKAKVLYGTGAERRGAAGEQAVQPATFRTRADSLTRTVKVTDRIAFLGQYWDITSVVPIGGPAPSEIEFTAIADRFAA